MNLDQRRVRGRQPRIDQSQDQNGYRVGHLHDHSQRKSDQCRRPPAKFQHRPEEVSAFGYREKATQVADDLRGVRHRVGREQYGIERERPKSGVQPILGHGPVDSHQAAHAVQRETETQLDRWEVKSDDQQECVTRRAIGQFRVQHADDLDLHHIEQRGVQHSGVLALVRVK